MFCSSKKEKIIYIVLLIISIIPGAIYIAYLLFAHVLLGGDSVTSLFETNPDESKEFVANYMSVWVNVAIGIYATIPAIMIWKMKAFAPLKIREHKKLFISSIIALACIFAIPQLAKSVYILNFYKTFVLYKVRLNYEEKAIAERQQKPYEVTETVVDSIPQTIIVVIGESLTRNHMGLYGYSRQTTPLLSQKLSNLYVYTDVVSPQVHTIPVIRSLLSFIDKENPDYYTAKPSLFELFNRAGYETYFISNQPFGGNFKTSYDDLLNLAQHKYDMSKQKKNDDVLLPEIKKILDSSDKVKNKIIVVHLVGNHMAYEFRYPASFNKFDYKKDNLVSDAPYRDAKAKKDIDYYDNSVLFNDYIISSMIDMLAEKKGEETSLIYMSDHGEELFDKREFAGHAYEKVSKYMCEIPFIVWVSDSFRDMNPNLVFETKRAFSSNDFLYSLTNFAGLEYKDYVPEKSLFSSHFKSSERYVGKMTYEEVLELEK